MILDTSFLIDLMDGRPAAVEFAETIEEREVPQRIPAQVVYELFVGVGYTDRTAEERSKVTSVIETRPVVETSTTIARLAGRIDGTLRREGEHVSPNDVIIGATARHLDEPVVTADRDDFEKLPSVQLADYADA